MNIKLKRTAREIKVDNKLINNKNISVRIGTVENRNAPETIYIFISFWAKPSINLSNESQDFLKSFLNDKFNDVYKNNLKNILKNNKYFTDEKNNIFIKNIPENINYNNNKNFISIELYLHTLNVGGCGSFPLNNKKNTELFNEALKISNTIGDSSILTDNNYFEISIKSK